MLILDDIKNYFFIKRQIKEMKKLPEWNKLNLRSHGGNIFTVRNVNTEIFGEQDNTVKLDKVREYFEPVFDWLLKWNLQDVMIPAPLKQIKDSNAYLLVLKPFPKVLTINYMLAVLTIVGFFIGLFVTILNIYK